MLSFRGGASLLALVCLVPASASGGEKEKLSLLSKVMVLEKKDDVQVTLIGSRAPDFTSFTTANPFGVVVDWAGSRIEGAQTEQKFGRGLIRKVRTKQYDSEAERISRVTIELSRETTYHVEAHGTRVIVHFEPVADPIPEPQPKPEPVAKKEETKDLVYLPEGPLTEPDLPVPENPPRAVARLEPPKPAPAQAPAPAAPKKEEPKIVQSPPPKPATVVARVEPKKEEPARSAEAPRPAPMVVAKVEPAKNEVPKSEAKEPRKSEPVLAKTDAKREAPTVVATYVPARVVAPVPRAVRSTPPRRTNQIAGNSSNSSCRDGTPCPSLKSSCRDGTPCPSLKSSCRDGTPCPSLKWTPPGAGRVRSLPVVRYGIAQETIKPNGETSIDPDEPTGAQAGESGDNEVDPGPRLMKYIGFRQMADVSRVFVRLDGKAKFRSKKEGDTVVVELVDTSVPIKNNTRPLDTSYFNSPVGNVQAVPAGNSTRIEIKLKEQVPFQVKRIGTTIAIDFTRK